MTDATSANAKLIAQLELDDPFVASPPDHAAAEWSAAEIEKYFEELGLLKLPPRSRRGRVSAGSGGSGSNDGSNDDSDDSASEIDFNDDSASDVSDDGFQTAEVEEVRKLEETRGQVAFYLQQVGFGQAKAAVLARRVGRSAHPGDIPTVASDLIDRFGGGASPSPVRLNIL